MDLKILSIMQANCLTTTSKLAEALSMSETPCWRRLKRLEDEGFIEGYQAMLNKEALGFEVIAFVHLSVDLHTEEVTRKLEEKIILCPEVVALYNVTGDYDFLVKIVCKSIALYTVFIEKTLRKIPCITQIKTSITLREVYDSKRVPLSAYL
ncbi:Lrp/AsnC family transcriptional regulator [Pseudomonas syringae pv. tagetis]|uniref:Lrp/AsnC family transcriptional regulator n=1 Tax=Pseudomonas syringae pv. tagetis TaxID=129140 RepID=A0ABW7NFT3_9PSED|nr:Lrp/AsnC family transcriptional regulator [Pseudomonas syringae group genomosp. 7]